VAPIPLLWVVPLALYLLTFILSFSSSRFYSRTALFPWLAAALGSMAYLYVHGDSNLHIQYVIPVHLVGLFICCLACHGELAWRRPPARFLTRFYLLIALGGALGGAFVALIAPKLFDTYLELPLLLIVIAVLNAVLQWRRRGSMRTLWLVRLAMVGGVVALSGFLMFTEMATRNEHLLVRRNFYGVLRVRDELVGTQLANRNLIHGTISHGSQFLSDAYRDVAGSYFSTSSGVGRALQALQAQDSVRYGVIGLGAGVLASYAREGDYLRIYEINPDVFRIADEFFTFLARARAAGADTRVLLGDGRLVLDREERQNFDLLVVDAFSSDAVPTHLLTNEAVQLYFEHLKPGGVLAIQISNRYLDLAPVCLRAAEHVNRSATVVRSSSDGMVSASVWVLITSNNDLLHQPQFQGARMRPATADAAFRGWTDQFSSVWPLLTLDGGAGSGTTR
jgi:SAM-dependent methyltransferase